MDVVYNDLRTLNAQARGFTSLPEIDDERTCEEWQRQWQARPSKVKNLLKRAQAHHVRQTRLRYEVVSFHERLHDLLVQAGRQHQGTEVELEPRPHFCLLLLGYALVQEARPIEQIPQIANWNQMRSMWNGLCYALTPLPPSTMCPGLCCYFCGATTLGTAGTGHTKQRSRSHR